ncbi:hypothetical protein [Agrococcus sp. SGAir0287]|uniref:hypothetical protein n=1 Tax=Agrococcus sp. SGAir0287 TaxID=2070347 RepID=UPI0010CCBE04|nr:hypothetical protein [Agrococcus sp. SGAir0287]QCR19810.1 hypothetical protein C1N71_10525 [Agrococcus sp. SGAir0287]
MQRRRLALLASIGAAGIVLVGCAASEPPSVTTADPATLPGWVEPPTPIAAEYAVGERDGVVFTALEAESGEWCLAIHDPDEQTEYVVACSEGPIVTAGSDGLATARLEIDGVGDASDGEAVSDWVVVVD